jgi:hypothetical protein
LSELEVPERLDNIERWQKDIEKRFLDAFPGGDHVGHCRYHQLMIEGIEAKTRLRQAVVEKTVGGLIWAGLIVLGLAMWQYVKSLLRA